MNIACVILCYNPNIDDLNSTLSLIDSVSDANAYIYDNNSTEDYSGLVKFSFPNVHIIKGSGNVGVAGTNVAIKRAFSDGVDVVVILDQDSNVPLSYFESVRDYFSRNTNHLSILSPTIKDVNRSSKSKYDTSSNRYQAVDSLIGSGMAFTENCWEKIGPFREDFFLDFVDIEWCIRAKRHDIYLVKDNFSTMPHKIGEHPISILGMKFSSHSPLRHYYYSRNAICLALEEFKCTPLWSIKVIGKVFVQAVLYSFFSSERLENTRMFFLGIKDGFLRQLGVKYLNEK